MLDYEELKNGVKDYGLNLSKAELDELFACFDKDNSGSISFDEFILALRVANQLLFIHISTLCSRSLSIEEDEDFAWTCNYKFVAWEQEFILLQSYLIRRGLNPIKPTCHPHVRQMAGSVNGKGIELTRLVCQHHG